MKNRLTKLLEFSILLLSSLLKPTKIAWPKTELKLIEAFANNNQNIE